MINQDRLNEINDQIIANLEKQISNFQVIVKIYEAHISQLEKALEDVDSTLNLVMNDSELRASDDGFTLLYKLKEKITQALEKASQ